MHSEQTVASFKTEIFFCVSYIALAMVCTKINWLFSTSGLTKVVQPDLNQIFYKKSSSQKNIHLC